MNRKNTKAFTLAEVLITLGIIGVVAAMTIPVLVQKHQEQENIVKLKKFYSTFSQAIEHAKVDYGEMSEWSDNEDKIAASVDWVHILKQYLNITKECTTTGDFSCFADNHATLSGAEDNWKRVGNWANVCGISNFVMSDGTAVRLAVYSPTCTYQNSEGHTTVCGLVSVDLNGYKKPNVQGKDSFGFLLLKDKLIPFGTPAHRGSIEKAQETLQSIMDKTGSGDNGAGWIITNGNMDYLHCDDLSWTGKTKCKK